MSDEIDTTIDFGKLPSSTFNWGTGTNTISIGNGVSGILSSASPYSFSTGSSSYSIGNSTPSLRVTGEAEFDGDIKWKGRSLGSLLEKIEDRLAILQPDPEKLEKFAALKASYEHYKLLEALCSGDIPIGPTDA
jgi:hypothetical protein